MSLYELPVLSVKFWVVFILNITCVILLSLLSLVTGVTLHFNLPFSITVSLSTLIVKFVNGIPDRSNNVWLSLDTSKTIHILLLRSGLLDISKFKVNKSLGLLKIATSFKILLSELS